MQIGLIITNYFLMPVTMILICILFRVVPPNYKNPFYGYRTPGSRKSPEAWEYAHKAMIKSWTIMGIGMFVLSVLVVVIYPGALTYELVTFGTKYMFFQVVLMLIPIVPIEYKLYKYF